jgi:hypothetical protein
MTMTETAPLLKHNSVKSSFGSDPILQMLYFFHILYFPNPRKTKLGLVAGTLLSFLRYMEAILYDMGGVKFLFLS